MVMEKIRSLFHAEDVESLRTLFIGQLRDLYSAESQQIEGLGYFGKAASSQELKALFSEHIAQTLKHKKRLDEIFKSMGVSSDGGVSKAMRGLIEEAKTMAGDAETVGIRDASLISSAQRIEHYEIAGYCSVLYFARRLQLDDAGDLLELTLDEEYDMDERLVYMNAELLRLVYDEPATAKVEG